MSERHDPPVGKFKVCEGCGHIFNWDVTQHLPHGKLKDGSCVCPRCQSEFVRKFRESDLDAIEENLVCPDVVV